MGHEKKRKIKKKDKNKAGYTASEVACGWAGAVMKKAYPSI